MSLTSAEVEAARPLMRRELRDAHIDTVPNERALAAAGAMLRALLH